jgi:hypothetical protein
MVMAKGGSNLNSLHTGFAESNIREENKMSTTLTTATLLFKAHKDGKDADTLMPMTITNDLGIIVATADLTGVGIGDNDSKSVSMKCSSFPFAAADALAGSLNITFEPNGDDTFLFDLSATLAFSDDSAIGYVWLNRVLNEDALKSLSLPLNKPVGAGPQAKIAKAAIRPPQAPGGEASMLPPALEPNGKRITVTVG